MPAGPSKTAEAIVAMLVPPACREEVLGDLHERYRSSGQYACDAARTVPMVVVSRIRRSADPQLLLMEAFALYVSFVGAAWLGDRRFLEDEWGLLRLAVPAAIVVAASTMEYAYAKAGRQSRLRLMRGPMLGVLLAIAFEGVLRISNPAIALPAWVTVDGCAADLVMSSAVRLLFPPADDGDGRQRWKKG